MSEFDADAVNRTDVKPWQDEGTLVWALHDKELSLADAGKLLGCAQGSVQYWRDKLDPQPNTHTRQNTRPWADVETLRWALHKFGTSERAGRQLGCSRSAVNRRVNRHDLRDQPWKDEDTLRELYGQRGLSQDQIADRFGVTQDTIAYWLREFDIASHDCPTCGESFSSRRGVKIHHTNVHDETIAGVLVECATCGQTVRKPPSRVERVNDHFCSPECHPGGGSGEDNPNWRGGYTEDRDTDWPELRGRALEADDYRCQGCGRHDDAHRAEHGVGLHVHHIRPVVEFDEPSDADTVDNLVSLCRNCHNEWEGIPLRPALND